MKTCEMGKWLEASKTIASSLQLIRSGNSKVEEEKIRIMPSIKLEMVRQQQKIVSEICQRWKKSVLFSRHDIKCIFLLKFQEEEEMEEE